MRTRKNISTLSIAAIAILAAAATSFAQTNDRGAEAANTVTVSGSELTAINTKQPAAIETAIRANTISESLGAKSVSETRPVVKTPKLSAAMFITGSRFATVNADQFVNQQLTVDMKIAAGVPTNTADQANESGETKTKSVAFIPSRMPKFPYREP